MEQRAIEEDVNLEEPSAEPKVYSAPALDKGLDILEALSNSEVALTQKELSVVLGRSVSEFYRMLSCLVRREYVANYQDKFSITTKLFRLAQVHPPTRRLITEAMPIMQDLARQVDYSCDLRVYNQGSQTVIASVEAPSGIGFAVKVGSEIAVAPTASGRVLVAFQAPEIMELRMRESMANCSAAEVKSFRRDVHDAAIKGFSSIDSHQYAGVHAVSFPVLDNNRHAIAAITVPMLPRVDGVAQMSLKNVEETMRQSVMRLCERIG